MPRRSAQRPPGINQAPARPKPIRTFSRQPKGPRLFQQKAKPDAVGGPGDPPLAFLDPTLHGSATEWIVYWALAKIFNTPKDPRQGPYIGGPPDWVYQKWVLGGRSSPGGAVIDFVVNTTQLSRPVGLRLVTEFFHLYAGPNKIASDRLQMELVSREMDVVDIIDFEITGDRTGQTAIVRIKEALGFIQRPDPIRAGTVRRNRT